MQHVTRKKMEDGTNLTCITTEKFKRTVLRAALLLPLGGPDAAFRAILPSVLRRGTINLRNMGEIGAKLDSLYGARIETIIRKEGETLVIGFLSDVIDEKYTDSKGQLTAEVISLLTELLYNPYVEHGVFSEEYTLSEKENLVDRIRAQKDDPRSYAPLRLTQIMCENESYGKSALGTEEQADLIGAKKLFAVYQRALEEAAIELFYCGSMEPDKVQSLFETAMPKRKGGKIYTPETVIVAKPQSDVREVVEEMQVSQGKLSLGFRTGGNSLLGGDTVAYQIFQTLYGGSTSSKLFLNVREKKSLCYYASAQYVSQKGIMLVNSGIENKSFEEAKEEILLQLQLCKDGEISFDEIESARKTLSGAFRAMLDEPLQLERFWLAQAIAGTLKSPEERIEEIAKVSKERIVTVANETMLDTVYFMKGVAQ